MKAFLNFLANDFAVLAALVLIAAGGIGAAWGHYDAVVQRESQPHE